MKIKVNDEWVNIASFMYDPGVLNKPIESEAGEIVELSADTILNLNTRNIFRIKLPADVKNNVEYEFMFKAGDDVDITWPDGINLGDFDPKPDKEYDCIIFNNRLYYYEW